MDDHPPQWQGNGMAQLEAFGLSSNNCVRLNVFLPRATMVSEGPKMSEQSIDSIALAVGLVDNFSLNSIELHRCDISDEGISAISQALAVNKYLTDVGLSRNRFGTNGGVSLGECLKINQTLKSIDLSWNELRDSAAASLAEALQMNNSLQQLRLDRNHLTDDGVGVLAAALGENTKLKYLGLSRNKLRSTGCSFLGRALERSRTLYTLDISMNGVPVEGIFALCGSLGKSAEYTALQTLNLAYNKVGSSVVMLGSFLRNARTLRELNLECTMLQPGPELTQFARLLAANTTLSTVSFASNALMDSGVQTICDALVGLPLRYVDFTDVQCTAQSIASIAQYVVGSKQLETLHLSLNSFAELEESAAAIGDMIGGSTSLRFFGGAFIHLNEKSARAFAEALRRGAPAITGLSLRGNSIGDEGWSKIVQLWLFHYSNLEYLDLASNGLTERALERVNDVFENNAKLRYIVIEDSIVVSEENMYQPYDKIKELKVDRKLPLPPCCRAPSEIGVDFAPTEGFSTYSVTTGSVMKRHVEGVDTLSQALFSFAGKPVKSWMAFEDSMVGVVPRLSGPSADAAKRWAFPSVEETAKMESNIGGLLVSDDQMRREFNRLDVEGAGYLDIKTFKNVYRSFESFGVELTERQLDRLLTENSTNGQITFDNFCVLILKIAQH